MHVSLLASNSLKLRVRGRRQAGEDGFHGEFSEGLTKGFAKVEAQNLENFYRVN